MLGFDALGRQAIGQAGALTTILTASAASFTLTGQSVTFRISQTSGVGAYTVTGNAAPFVIYMTTLPTSFAVTGNTVFFVTSQRRPLYISGQGYWRGTL